MHSELSKSSAADAYVWKDDTAVVGTRFELGTRKLKRNSKHDWDAFWVAATTGKFLDIPASVRISSYAALRVIRADHAVPLAQVRTCSVFWGATGTGKSRLAWGEAGMGAFPKDPRTKFWDGYNGEDHVVIDEFRGSIDIGHLLRWLDRYPVRVEIKGSATVLRCSKIWITSNLCPEQWYPDLDDATRRALLRRLDVHHFDDDPFNLNKL